jgi:hypothetical protein
VLYVVDVFAESKGEGSYTTWTVKRRYSEFDDLRCQIEARWSAKPSLARQLQMLSSFAFPEKTGWSSATDSVLQDRMIMLERWLNSVLALTLVTTGRAVQTDDYAEAELASFLDFHNSELRYTVPSPRP